MLASHDEKLIEHARKLSQQARDHAPHYQHSEIGYNYRMSNILAAIGRGQLKVLDQRVERKREIFDLYRRLLGDMDGIQFMPESPQGRCNRWLTVVLVDPAAFGVSNDAIRLKLESENIESRPVWKPMHLQPVFAGCPVRGGAVSERLFRDGLCLPSGTAMTDEDVERVAGLIRDCARGRGVIAGSGNGPTAERVIALPASNGAAPEMKVPFSRPSITQAELDEVADALRSGWLTTGPKTKKFERDFADYVGQKHGVALNSCTAALHLALEAIGLKEGDVAVVPTMTFAATAEVVRYFNATPLLVDCRESDFNLDVGDAGRRMRTEDGGRKAEGGGRRTEDGGRKGGGGEGRGDFAGALWGADWGCGGGAGAGG